MDEPVVMPHRKFVQWGKLIVIQKAGLMRNLVEKRRVGYLFSDCLVLTTESFSWRDTFHFRGARLGEGDEGVRKKQEM